VAAVPLLLLALVVPRRGPVAFHYAPVLTEAQLAWYSQFDLLVTHDPLPRAQVDRLHAAGTKLLFYEWAVAFYDSRATPWQRSLRRTDALLHDAPLTGGVGSHEAGAWYFDPADRRHRRGRAADIVRKLAASRYDGVFLDTTTFASVHAAARKEYERRHPRTPYDAAYARFLRELRRRMPKGVIFTNQGYRSAEHYLPYADWDLTESLITDASARLRPWDDPARPWESIRFVMKTMIAPAMAKYPRVRFAHLNYIGEASPETIAVVVAVARLFGGEGFVAAPTLEAERDAIYFRDFGAPVSPRVDREDGSWQCFEHGSIAVTAEAPGSAPRATFDEAECGTRVSSPAGPRASRSRRRDAAGPAAGTAAFR
jgi:hypothetical protein